MHSAEADRTRQRGIPARQSHKQDDGRSTVDQRTSVIQAGMDSPALPLDSTTRRGMEQGFGRDLGAVRIHAGVSAARSAAALHASAYTVGNDIVFGAGRYTPAQAGGRQLLRHEIAHVVQQQSASGLPLADASSADEHEADLAGARVGAGLHSRPARAHRSPALARQDESEPVHVPMGSGRLTLIPGPGPLDLLGRRLPLPASMRATNAFGAGPGPTFVADLDPSTLMLHLLDNIDLQTTTPPGTPEGRQGDPAAQVRLALVRPTARLDFSSGQIDGWAMLHIPSSYPAFYHPGTDIAIRIESTVRDPLRWTVGASYGPLVATARIRLHYDVGRLGAALGSGLPELGRELTAPGVSVSGTARAFGIPTTAFGLEAASTRPRRSPLLGAPTSFPARLGAAGVIVAPPGSITSVAAPALGVTGAWHGERSGAAGTVALLPTISPGALSAGGPATSVFPVYAYAEVSYVSRVSDGLELGVRAVVQVNSAELFNPPRALPEPATSVARPQAGPAEGVPPALPPPISPFGGITVFGRFNAL